MNLYIETRVLNIADYIIETGATVRAAAGVFGVSKSTVHKDITERLRTINKALAEKVAAVLEVNRDVTTMMMKLPVHDRHINFAKSKRSRVHMHAASLTV